jgi:hypothetical protein
VPRSLGNPVDARRGRSFPRLNTGLCSSETTESSWHGFTRIELTSADRQDVSPKILIAVYILTLRERPAVETAASHGTRSTFRANPCHERFSRWIHVGRVGRGGAARVLRGPIERRKYFRSGSSMSRNSEFTQDDFSDHQVAISVRGGPGSLTWPVAQSCLGTG